MRTEKEVVDQLQKNIKLFSLTNPGLKETIIPSQVTKYIVAFLVVGNIYFIYKCCNRKCFRSQEELEYSKRNLNKALFPSLAFQCGTNTLTMPLGVIHEPIFLLFSLGACILGVTNRVQAVREKEDISDKAKGLW